MTDNKLTPFEQLKQDFPRFKVQNRTSVAKHVQLADGHTTQVQGNAFALIDANDLTSIPDMTTFKPISPSASDLIMYGVLTNREPEKADPQKKNEVVADPKKDQKEAPHFDKTSETKPVDNLTK